jgi:hypothetical protein
MYLTCEFPGLVVRISFIRRKGHAPRRRYDYYRHVMLWSMSFYTQKLLDDRYEEGQCLATTRDRFHHNIFVSHEKGDG